MPEKWSNQMNKCYFDLRMKKYFISSSSIEKRRRELSRSKKKNCQRKLLCIFQFVILSIPFAPDLICICVCVCVRVCCYFCACFSDKKIKCVPKVHQILSFCHCLSISLHQTGWSMEIIELRQHKSIQFDFSLNWCQKSFCQSVFYPLKFQNE